MAQSALRWILDQDAVTTVIPGASNTKQVIGNVASSPLKPLSPERHKELSVLYASDIQAHVRGQY